MAVRIFREEVADSVFIENSTGAFFTNQLKALAEADGTVTVIDEVKNIEIMSHIQFAEFVRQDDSAHGVDQLSTVDSLNAVFTRTGSNDPRAPVITSPTVITVGEGFTINYTMEAERGVFYQYTGLPDGIVNEEGNVRHIIGGSGLPVGTYVATMTAINFYGQDEQTLTIVVSDSPFVNSYSVRFSNNDRAQTAGLNVESVLGRSGEGAGVDDAWTLSSWIKPANNPSDQKWFSFGDNFDGEVALRYSGNVEERLSIVYGDQDNNITMTTDANVIPVDDWSNIMITYDGGTTGFSSGEFEGIVVGGSSLDNPDFDTTESWSLTNARIESGVAVLEDGDAVVAQRFKAGQDLVYDVTLDYKLGNSAVAAADMPTVKVYRYGGSNSLSDAKDAVNNNPQGGFAIINGLTLENLSSTSTTVERWLSPIAISENDIDGILTEDLTSKVMVFSGLLELPAGTTDVYIRSDDGYEFTFNGAVVRSFDGTRSYGDRETANLTVASAGQYPFSIVYYSNSVGSAGFRVSTDSAGNTPVSVKNLLVGPQISYANAWSFPGYSSLGDIRSRVNNLDPNGRWHVDEVFLENNSSSNVPTRSEWFSPISLHEEIISSSFGTNSISNTIVRWEIYLNLPAGTTDLYIKADDGYEVFFGGASVTSRGGSNSFNSLIRPFSVTVGSAGLYPMSINYYNNGVVGGFILATDAAATVPVSTNNILISSLSERDLKLRVYDITGATLNEVDFIVNNETTSTQSFQVSTPFSKDLFVAVTDQAYEAPETTVELERLDVVASNANNPTYLADAADFFTRFKAYVDGTEVNLTGTIKGNGWANPSNPSRMFLGDSGNTFKVDELALYEGIQDALAPTIYNGKNPLDLNDLTPTPNHWWRLGDGDTFPILKDGAGLADLTMINMTVADIVNDVPTDGSVPATTVAGSDPVVSFNVTADGTASSISITHSQGRLMSEARLFEPDGSVSELHLVNIDENTSVVTSSTPILGTVTLT